METNQNAPKVRAHIGDDLTSAGEVMSHAVGRPQFMARPNQA